MVLLHNLSADAVTVPLTLTDLPDGARLADLLAEGVTEPDERGRVELALDGYGYRWLRVARPGSRRLR
jgi:hypothetical protein